MKIMYLVVIAAITAIATTVLLIPGLVKGEIAKKPEPLVIWEIKDTPRLSSAQMIWLAKLMLCESGIKEGSINPKDLDNTPSYGLLQFKPSTFQGAAKKYELASTTDHMNAESQVAIVINWILDGSANWRQQFPACTDKLGLPPTK